MSYFSLDLIERYLICETETSHQSFYMFKLCTVTFSCNEKAVDLRWNDPTVILLSKVDTLF